MSVSNYFRGRVLGFEIQDIFPNQILTQDSPETIAAKNFLASIGFDLDFKGNKIPLLISPTVRDAVLNAPLAVQQVFIDSGFGFNFHNSQTSGGNHPGYNKFIISELARFSELAAVQSWNEDAKNRAAYDFHRFLKSINVGIEPPITGTDDTSFKGLWDAWKQADYRSITDVSVINVIDSYRGNDVFNTVIDGGSDFNSEMRYEVTEKLYQNADGILIADELANTNSNLSQASSSGSNSGHATAASISLIHDLQTRSATPITNLEAVVENLASKYYNFAANESGSVVASVASGAAFLEFLVDKIMGIFEKVRDFTAGFEAKLSDFGETVIAEMAKSTNQLLVGLGGNFVGDLVEFLNVAYEPIKKGFATGEWSDLGRVTNEYGAGAILSAILVTVTVVGVAAIAGAVVGPTAAAVSGALAAAGWAAYGLYDAVTNGAELLGKITTDLGKIIEIAGDRIEKGQKDLEALNAALMNVFKDAKAGNFDIPDFDGINNNVYVIDTAGLTLPDRIIADNPVAIPDGTENNEQYYSRNNTSIVVMTIAANDNHLILRNKA